MSHVQPPIKPHYQSPPPYAIEPESNGLGTAGFVISLISLFLCGIPAIIGVLLSLFALGKNPKGFAIAGLFIGLLGLLELVLCCTMAYGMYVAVNKMIDSVQVIATQAILTKSANEIGNEWEKTGELPNEVDGQIIIGETKDAYDQPVVYETDGNSFTMRSRGPDGVLITDDDITVGPYSTAEEAKKIYEPDFDDMNFPDDMNEREIEERKRKIREAIDRAKRNAERELDQAKPSFEPGELQLDF
ncbi:MAG: DUF4190 domain-containing protein [Planctomycetota bacterium]